MKKGGGCETAALVSFDRKDQGVEVVGAAMLPSS